MLTRRHFNFLRASLPSEATRLDDFFPKVLHNSHDKVTNFFEVENNPGVFSCSRLESFKVDKMHFLLRARCLPSRLEHFLRGENIFLQLLHREGEDIHLWTRPRVRRHYPPDLSISLSGGKETNRDPLSRASEAGKAQV
jgi:hypothetical protein